MNIRRQRGVALVLVLWITVLVTIATGSFAVMARMDMLEANALLSGTRARLAAEAGINIAAVALRETEEDLRPIADGRPLELFIDDVRVELMITDERGKLDLNAAEEGTLITLFINNGLEVDASELLAAAILDWRDTDEVERVNGAEYDSYMAAGLPIGPANRPFMMVDELLQVLGMSYELYRRILPGITVFSRVKLPELAYAPVEALMAVPEISSDEAVNFVAERQSMDRAGLDSVTLTNGQPVMARGRGLTYSIVAKATMPNGVWEQIETTIRLGGSETGLPYRVLRWREGFHQ